MRALVIEDFESRPVFRDVAVGEPGPDQVRIRLKTAGLNRFDTTIASGMLKGMVEYEFPVVLGRDGSGVVDAIGDGVDGFAVGDRVLGHVLMNGTLHEGTLAEFALVPANGIVRKPNNIDFVEAAALPLAAAAAHGVVDAVGLKDGSSVLIVGASGGVGSYAIQLAARRGATVVATGLPDDVDRLRRLGAAEIVDWTDDIVEQVRRVSPEGVDALIDLVNFDSGSVGQLATVVRRGGTVASALRAADADALAARGLSAANVIADPSRDTLSMLVSEIENGTLRIDVEEVLPFDEAITGLDKLANGGAKGKIVVSMEN